MLHKKSIYTVATAIIFLIIAVVTVVSTVLLKNDFRLYIKNADTNEIYKSFKIYEGMEFSIEFIHSVNKSPVCDIFEIKDNDIYVIKTRYSAFGAGVQTELEEGQTLSYDENKNMIISGFNKKFDKLSYIVGTVYDHVLVIKGKKISLTELCGKNSAIEFYIE